MRVVFVGSGMIPIPPPDYGAVEKHVWNLSKALERAGHDVSIVSDVFGPKSADEYKFALWAARKVKSLEYDVLHVHTPGVAAVFSLFGPREFVYTTHSRHWSSVQGLGDRYGLMLEKRAARKAREVIAVSPMVACLMADVRRPHVIPNGVDVELYKPLPEKRGGGRIVGLGEIAPHKMWHLAAEAVKGTPWQLTIVGPFRDPRYATRVEASAPGQVRLTGPVSEAELAGILGESDVQVHPSVSEGLPMALLEGMSAGLPVVAGSVVKDVVLAGETGFVVDSELPHDEQVAAIRARIGELVEDADARGRMSTRARERALEAYSWDVVATQVAAVYEASIRQR